MGQVDLEYETELIWRYDPGWTDITIATGVCLYGPLTLAFIADANVSYSLKVCNTSMYFR